MKRKKKLPASYLLYKSARTSQQRPHYKDVFRAGCCAKCSGSRQPSFHKSFAELMISAFVIQAKDKSVRQICDSSMGRKNGRGRGKEGKRARNAEILLEHGNVFPHTYVEQTHSPILDRKHRPVVQRFDARS